MWEWVESATIGLLCQETNQWLSHLHLLSKLEEVDSKVIHKTSSQLLINPNYHNPWALH